jgi:hypothetical protein
MRVGARAWRVFLCSSVAQWAVERRFLGPDPTCLPATRPLGRPLLSLHLTRLPLLLATAHRRVPTVSSSSRWAACRESISKTRATPNPVTNQPY